MDLSTSPHPRRLNGRGGYKSTPKATVSPSLKDLAWAAGFMEGEGCFTHTGTAERAQAAQVNPEPILRLQRMFGGSTVVRTNRRPESFGHITSQPITCWSVSSARARGVMLTLYPMLSARRQEQIRVSLARTKPKPRPRKAACIRGHAFDEANTLHYRGFRICRQCRRLNKARG